MTYGSLFTGIGGFDLGFNQAGLKCAWQVEKDKDCNRVLARQFPDTQRGRLVEDVTPERFGRVDVICGGFPCQDLSVAGKRKGLAGARSGLWGQFHRILAEFKPSGFTIENVPGLFSSCGGRDLLTIVRGLAELGYCVAWCVLDSQYRGVAQRRERVFIVGSLGNGSCAQVLFEPESVRGDPAPSRETGQSVAGTIGGSSQSGGFRTTDLDNSGAFPVVARCLNSERDGYNDGSDQTYIPMTAGCITQGAHPGSYNGQDAHSDRLVAVAFAENQRAEVRVSDIAPQLSCSGGKPGSGYSAVAFTERSRDQGRTFESQDEIAYALTNPGSGGRTHSRQIAQGMMVRRLTPRECERLQGFPDDWTHWDAQGKEISDSARYRMLGNAVSVPIAFYLGQQLLRFAS